MIEAAVGDPVSLVIGDEEFILRAHANATGRAKSRSQRLKVPSAIRAIDPSSPRGIIGHIAAALSFGFAIGDGEISAGPEIERGVFPTERIDNRAVVIFMVFAGDAKGVGNAFVAITDAVFVVIDQLGEFGFLCDVIGALFDIVIDAIGLHEIFGKAGPGFVFVFPDLAFPGDNGEGVIRLVTKSKNSHGAFGEGNGFDTIAGWDLGQSKAGE
ncbi:hypothetical protein N9237_01605 [Akkermansiaceae bacterium]|nr:hypothetical protein [Akkermansiaceae bacterium]